MSDTPQAAEVWTVRRVLEWTTQHLKKQGSETPRLDAEILLAHSRNCPRIALYTQFDEPLSEPTRAKMRELVQRRAQAEPVAYLVGHREFFSLDFQVTRDVLIPRPDTETLVLAALDAAKSQTDRPPPPRFEGESVSASCDEQTSPEKRTNGNGTVLDLCTGSGCVAIFIAKHAPATRLIATDLSPAALAVARENAVKHQVADRIDFRTGDLFAATPENARFAIITANPPYVTTAEIETLAQDIRKFEPRSALDGGVDGLDVVRRIVHDAPDHLEPGGALFIEISPEQASAVEQLLADFGPYGGVRLMKDLSGRPRVAAANLRHD